MCVIISKEKKCNRIPTIEELTNCFLHNRDGAGFMYVNNGEVVIDKGYMELNSFLSRFEELCNKFHNFKNKALVIHCRIGTSSSNSAENTHPYCISTKVKDLHKKYITTDLGVAHNGIITSYTPHDKSSNVNDTQKFILEYLAPVHKHFSTFYKMDTFRAGIRDITNSKFTFLDTKERIYYVGDFVNDNGLKFSNTSYKSYESYYMSSKNAYTKYSSKYNNYYDDDDIFEYYDKQKNLIYLKDSWSFYDYNSNIYEFVSDYEEDLIYDLDNSALYKITDIDSLVKIANNVIVYDSNYYEI